MRIAVVGAGFMGGVHAQLFNADPRAEVGYVVDLDEAAAKELAVQVGAEATTSLDDALEDPAVGLVVVATPAATHEPIATRCLEAGRHLLVEKPLVTRRADALRLGELAAERGLVLVHGGNFLYAPKFERLRQLAADTAALGPVHTVRVVFRTGGPDDDGWFRFRRTAGGGALTDLGWHGIELARWVLGKPAIEAVTACTQRVSGLGDVEEQGTILLHFAGGPAATATGGAVGQVDVSWLCPGGEQLAIEVIGTDGIVRADLWQGMGLQTYTNNVFKDVWEPNRGWSFPEWEWIRNSGYEHQDRHVLDAVLDGVPPAHSTADAAAVLGALEAAYESAEQQRRVYTHA